MKKKQIRRPSHPAGLYAGRMPAAAWLIVLLGLLAACANPGSGPDGGPYDETPPRILHMSPAIGARNSSADKVTLTFDEYIKLENAVEKIIVSPPQIEMPEIKTSGKKITVKLLDTLQQNTTYTIDFSDAILDNNEGNPMGQFTFYYSTGPQLDTMEVAGHVLAADNLEPVKGILVGLHSDTTDTAFTQRPFERVARTNGDGHFTIKGIAPGRYRIYALKDIDNDFKKARGEMLAFNKEIIVPSSYPDVRYDTAWIDTIRYDTIREIQYTHYTPDNVVLRAFTEQRNERHLLKTQRDVPEWFRIYFTAPSSQLPVIKGLNFDEKDAFLVQRSAGNDTVTYWLRDFKHFPQVDTLHLTCTYEAFDDSTRQNVMRTDTFNLIPRQTLARRLKEKEEEMEKWKKKLERRHKRGDYSNETPPVEFLRINQRKAGKLSPIENVSFSVDEPLASVDTAGIHLLLKKDSLLFEAPFLLQRDSLNLTRYTLMSEWRPGQSYELKIDSLALTGISGKYNDHLKQNITIPKMEEYGALFVILPDTDTCAVVQLMVSDDKISKQYDVKNRQAEFFYLNPGRYYLRLFYDRNGNGRWDTGDYDKGLQPEEVYYFPQAIDVRANWDIEQTWRVKELPLTQQKPRELIKQKEDPKKSPRSRNAERARQLGRR